MAYTDLAEIESYYMGIDIVSGQDSLITPDQVASFISQADAIINARLSKYYVTTFTDPDDLLIIKTLSSYMVVCRLDGRLRENDEENKFNFKRNLCKEAENLLKQIINGDIELKTTKVDPSVSEPAFEFNTADSDGDEVPYYQKIKDCDPDNFV